MEVENARDLFGLLSIFPLSVSADKRVLNQLKVWCKIQNKNKKTEMHRNVWKFPGCFCFFIVSMKPFQMNAKIAQNTALKTYLIGDEQSE